MAHFTKFANETHAKMFFKGRKELNEARTRRKQARIMQIALMVPDHVPNMKEREELAGILGVSIWSIHNYVKELKEMGRCPTCGHWLVGF